MSDFEALLWHLEVDPHLASYYANLTLLDQPPDFERLRRRMARATQTIDRLRQRVVPALGRWAPPQWRDDPTLDLDYHVRRVALPPPGDERQLFDLVSVLGALPLDRTRPLWEFTVIEGLADGRAALLQRLHHAVADGEGALRLSLEFLDLERDAPEPDAVPPSASSTEEPVAGGLVDTVLETVGHNLRRQLGVVRRTAEALPRLSRHPTEAAALAKTTVTASRAALRQVLVNDRAHSPLWTQRSLQRRLEVLRVPLADVKAAAKVLGGTVNDVFVTGVVGAVTAYHRDKGAEVGELRMAMPVSTRARDDSLTTNAFTPVRFLVPTNIADTAARFDAVRARLAAGRGDAGFGLVGAVASVLNQLPTSVLTRLARGQTETVDFATSNLRGASFPLFIAGARVEANYPIGPTTGSAFNITTLSYNGSLDMGAHIDTDAVDDPVLLRDRLEEAFAELLALA